MLSESMPSAPCCRARSNAVPPTTRSRDLVCWLHLTQTVLHGAVTFDQPPVRLYDDRLHVFIGGPHLATCCMCGRIPTASTTRSSIIVTRSIPYGASRFSISSIAIGCSRVTLTAEPSTACANTCRTRRPAMVDLLALAMSAAARPNSPISSRLTLMPADYPTSTGRALTSSLIPPACQMSWFIWRRSLPMNASRCRRDRRYRMSAATSVNTARLNLLPNELRLPAVEVLWPQFTDQSNKARWPAARFLAATAGARDRRTRPPPHRTLSRRGSAPA